MAKLTEQGRGSEKGLVDSNFKGFPRIYVDTSDRDSLTPATNALVEKMKEQGVTVEKVNYPHLFHVAFYFCKHIQMQ